jgi:flotillin
MAEAEAIEKKAEAQKKMGEASVLEMYFKAMPQIVAAASGPLENVDRITMYGDGNSAKMVGDIMKSTNQVMEAMADNGIDVKALLSGFMGGKAAN